MGKDVDWAAIEEFLGDADLYPPEKADDRFNAALKNMLRIPLEPRDKEALSYGP